MLIQKTILPNMNRRSICLVLSFALFSSSVLVPNSFAYGANQTDTLSNSLLQVNQAHSLAEQKKQLELAQQLLKNENLPSENSQNALNAISAALSSISSQGDHLLTTISPTTEDSSSVKEESNENVRTALWQVAQGRLNKDLENLDHAVLSRTDKNVETFDDEHNRNELEALRPGMIVENLRQLGLIRDFSHENRRLIEELYPTPLGEIADIIIADATRLSFMSSFGKRLSMLNEENKIGQLASMTGLSTHALISYAINANVIIRLADLYGIKLTKYDEDTFILIVLSMAKVGAYLGIRSESASRLADALGVNLAQALRRQNPAEALKRTNDRIRKSPTIIKAFAGIFGSKEIPTPDTADKEENEKRVESNNSSSNQDNKDLNHHDKAADQKPSSEHESQKGHKTEQNSEKSDHAKQHNKSLRQYAFMAAREITSFLWAAGETHVLGEFCKMTFEADRQRERELKNKSFADYIANSEISEGIIKLLVLSTQPGVQTPKSMSLNMSNDDKMVFIKSFAKSAQICSPQDRNLLEKKLNEYNQVSKQNSSINRDQLTREIKILQYACHSGRNSDSYLRVEKELENFNEIPQWYMTLLRTREPQHRLRIAELVLQLLLIDQDYAPVEAEFFNNTVLKVLGLESIEEHKYFESMVSFIFKNGGLERNESSPTGFSVRNGYIDNPYDLSVGFSPAHGPELPNTLALRVNTMGSNANR